MAGVFLFSAVGGECPVLRILVLVGQAGVRCVCCGGGHVLVLAL